MLGFLLLATAVTTATAQNGTMCECTVWTKEDRPGNRDPSMVAYLGSPYTPPSDCDATSIYDTVCYSECLERGINFKQGSGHCAPHIHDNKEVCFGDVWCERIALDNPGWTSEGIWFVRAYVSLKNCPDQEDIVLVEIEQPDVVQIMCCDETNLQTPCDVNDCECDIDEAHECECGLFIPRLFDDWKPTPNVDPLSLTYVGIKFNSSVEDGDWHENCFMFPSNPESPPEDQDWCTRWCISLEDELIGYSLDDPHPNNPGYSYGQMMCASLFARINTYEAFENEPLMIHGRVHQCPAAGVGWDPSVSFGQSDELLCCDANGGYYACPPL